MSVPPVGTKKILKIAIVYAMYAEARPLIERAGLRPVAAPDADLPMQYYEGQIGGASVMLSINGSDSRYAVDQIGTNAATLAAYLLVQHFKPDLVINPGTAGGVSSHGAAVGDVYVAQDEVVFHDRRVPVEKYRHYAVGSYPTLRLGKVISELGLKRGTISTANSFGCTRADLDSLIDRKTTMVEMEAGAIGWVAWEKKVPFLPVKGITDLIDVQHSLEEQFVTNFRQVSDLVAGKVVELIARIAGRSVGELVE